MKFQPVSMKEARRLYRRAEDFERQTRQPGRQDGALGRNGLKVIEALLFGFLNYRTGQLDPAYEAIARKACMSVRSVARGLKNLYQAGVLHWQRRCRPVVDEAGRCTLEQDTNAYGVRPSSQWQGYTAPAEAPAPDPETWGAAPVIERGTVEAGTFDRAYELIELDAQAAAGNALAAVLAQGLRRRMQTAETLVFSRCASLTEKHANPLFNLGGIATRSSFKTPPPFRTASRPPQWGGG